MQNLAIYASDRIRMHANYYNEYGLGRSTKPYLILPVDATDEALREAIDECLNADTSEAPEDKTTEEYYATLGVRSQKDLGRGLDVVREDDGRYVLSPIDRKGLFGEPVEVADGELVRTVRGLLGLPVNSE